MERPMCSLVWVRWLWSCPKFSAEEELSRKGSMQASGAFSALDYSLC